MLYNVYNVVISGLHKEKAQLVFGALAATGRQRRTRSDAIAACYGRGKGGPANYLRATIGPGGRLPS